MDIEDCHEYESLFINQLEKLRQQKGVSQREMSLAIGQTEGYISKLTNPKTQHLPRMIIFFWICDYLGIHPKDFFDESVAFPGKIEEINKNLCKLSEDQLAYISAMIKDIAKSK